MRIHSAAMVSACVVLLCGCRLAACGGTGAGAGRPLPKSHDFSDGPFCRLVAGDGVRVRAKPCISAEVLGSVSKGDRVRSACSRQSGHSQLASCSLTLAIGSAPACRCQHQVVHCPGCTPAALFLLAGALHRGPALRCLRP